MIMIISPIPIMANRYTIVPSAEYPFDRCDALSRYVFGLIYDRWKLSTRTENRARWTDENGIYCVFDQSDIAKELGITLPTVRRCLNQLEDEKVIKRERTGKRGACRYYTTARARFAMGMTDGYADYLDERLHAEA